MDGEVGYGMLEICNLVLKVLVEKVHHGQRLLKFLKLLVLKFTVQFGLSDIGHSDRRLTFAHGCIPGLWISNGKY